MVLLEVGTPAAMAPLVTVYGQATQIPMATPGPLATWEEAVTAHGAQDSAPDTSKDHTQEASTQDTFPASAQDMHLASAIATAPTPVTTDMEAAAAMDQAASSSPRPSEERALLVPTVQARRHPAARAASDA